MLWANVALTWNDIHSG